MKSRKIKEMRRSMIRSAFDKGCIDDKYPNYIHYIWDDFIYWYARYAWEDLHKGKNYEDHFSEKQALWKTL